MTRCRFANHGESQPVLREGGRSPCNGQVMSEVKALLDWACLVIDEAIQLGRRLISRRQGQGNSVRDLES